MLALSLNPTFLLNKTSPTKKDVVSQLLFKLQDEGNIRFPTLPEKTRISFTHMLQVKDSQWRTVTYT
jgi:hypothetical protein